MWTHGNKAILSYLNTVDLTFYITITYTYKTIIYIIAINLQLRYVNVTGEMSHVKRIFKVCHWPRQECFKYSIQSCVNGISTNITSPARCRWQETFVDTPEILNYTLMFKYLMKRKVIVYVCSYQINACIVELYATTLF